MAREATEDEVRTSNIQDINAEHMPDKSKSCFIQIMTICAYVPAEVRNTCWYKMQDEPKTPRTRTVSEVHRQSIYMSDTSVLRRMPMMKLEHKSVSLRCLDHLAALRKEYPGRFIIIIFNAVEVSCNFC